MPEPEAHTRPTLAYAPSAAPLTLAEILRAVIPASVVLAVGVALPLGIAHWLSIRYGPDAITQWAANAKQVEFWYCDVPLVAWLVLWAIALAFSLRRCATAAARNLSIGVCVLTLLAVDVIYLSVMDGPFP